MTFASSWARSVETHPDATFLIFEAPGIEGESGATTTWTYSQFDLEVQRVAAFLQSEGTGEGSAVHLALTNSPTFVAVWIAATRLGAWVVPGDPMGRTPEFADQIERTKPTVGFYAAAREADYLGAVPPAMSALAIDETDATFSAFPEARFADWPTPEPLDRAAVMFTSGTTGRPKGVEITQANYAFAGKVMAEAADLTADDRHIVVLPLFHANAQYYSFASAIWVGASVALMHTFSASSFLPQAARHQATCASLFAAPMRMILARGAKTEGVTLRHCWFAQNIADDQYETLTDWLGCQPRQLYGMTETIPAVLSDEAAKPQPDAMGFVTAGCEVQIHRADGTPAATDEVGEIVVSGTTGITLFASYLDDPGTTSASFRDTWFLTGDRASRNIDGRFFFDGRRSDVLKVAGENVSTVEVEAVLTSHPKVLEASVIGAPDPIRDEVPVAFVVPTSSDDPPTGAELLEWCATRLGKAKQPREVTFLDELPRTSVGKIRKFILKEQHV